MGLTSIKLPDLRPPKGSGLEQLGRLLKKYAQGNYSPAGKGAGSKRSKPQIKKIKRYVRKKGTTVNKINLKNPLEALKGPVQSITRSLNNVLGQIVKKPEVIDYTAIVKSFLPENAKLLKPRLPMGAQEVMQADLDGDRRDELIATYRTNEGIRTLILKAQGEKWQKAAEIYHQAHEDIDYRNAVRLTGENKLQLLTGMTGGGYGNMLYGYTLADGAAARLFSRGYSWVELVRKPQKAGSSRRDTLSVWNKAADGDYDIEVLDWSGLQLERANDDTYYYRTRVVPYYLKKARQNPSSTGCWYRLAEAMIKAGAYRDALVVAEAGSRQEQDQQLKEKFISLKKDIQEKYY